MKVFEKYSLKNKSSIKIGGIVDTYISIENKDELDTIAKDYRDIFFLGNGTNTLIYDGEIHKTVVSLDMYKVTTLDETTVYIEAGGSLGLLTLHARTHDLGGIEELSGIPGSIGGLIYMNGGAHGKEIFDVVKSVDVWDAKNGLRRLAKSEIKYGYRTTQFQHDNSIIVGAEIVFHKGLNEKKMNDVALKRHNTQPLDKPNIGSIFRNPEGHAAGALIESVGLKGYIIGGAQISEKHANFIINRGTATYDEVQQLIELAKKRVKDKYDIDLREEIVTLK